MTIQNFIDFRVYGVIPDGETFDSMFIAGNKAAIKLGYCALSELVQEYEKAVEEFQDLHIRFRNRKFMTKLELKRYFKTKDLFEL